VLIDVAERGFPVDWIEKIFHVSPDGGNGATELLIMLSALLFVATVVTAFVVRRVRRRGRLLARRERTPPED
jgi:hypothetical protein